MTNHPPSPDNRSYNQRTVWGSGLLYLGSQVAAMEDVVHRMNESNRGFGINAKTCLYEEVIVSRRWTFLNSEYSRGEVFEKFGGSVTNAQKSWRVGWIREYWDGLDRWGEWMNTVWLEGYWGRVRGRQRFGWMDGVELALGSREMATTRKIGRSGEPWCIRRWLSFTRPFLLGSRVL